MALANTTISTIIVNTPYLEYNIWVWLLLLGFGFLILSHLTNKDQMNSLWAMIAPPFLITAAYFANMIAITQTDVTFVNSTPIVAINTVVTPQSWLAYFLGIWFVASLISMFYIWTKKPIEKTDKKDW